MVVKWYKLFKELKKSFPKTYSEKSPNVPFLVGDLQLGKYDFLIIMPSTSNTVGKIAAGISDTLLSNAAAQAMKAATKASIKAAARIKTIRAKMIPILPLSGGRTDEENRKLIKHSGGAIAWRQGMVGGKDRWDTIIHPYESNAEYVMVLGKKPDGATIVARGKGSAYATAQMLRGKPPTHRVTVDSGFQDIGIEPKGKRGIRLDYTPDPKMQTTGDITIGQRTSVISPRSPRLSRGTIRITPRMPRIRR